MSWLFGKQGKGEEKRRRKSLEWDFLDPWDHCISARPKAIFSSSVWGIWPAFNECAGDFDVMQYVELFHTKKDHPLSFYLLIYIFLATTNLSSLTRDWAPLQQWKPRILTTRPPGNSSSFVLFDCWMFVRCLQRWVACVDYISLLTCKHGSTA